MADISIWGGTANFNASQNPTPFGFYDDDTEFQTDAPNVAVWCAQRLGYPLVDVELQQEQFFAAFEEAVTEYGAQVYTFQIINNLGRIKGTDTGSTLNQILITADYGNNLGTGGGGGGGSGVTYNLANNKLYSASLDVKKGIQKYNLITSTPAYASTTIEWANSGALTHSSSITITDTNGVTVHYRATTGSSAGGHIDGIALDDENIPQDDVPNMITGSGEYRRYIHASASKGEFVTGSYVGRSPGIGGVVGSAAVGDLSASVDSFISTIENGPHKNSFTVSSSLSSSGAHFITLTQKVEGAGGNTQITSSLTDLATGLPANITASAAFTGGSSGLTFESSGSQIQAKSKQIEIKKIYHYQPAAINRYFDPYAGTGTGIQSLMETFGFGNYSPGVNFMLMPMYFDALKLQAIEMNDKIRKSAYHFELTSGKYLKLFPIPTKDYTLWFEYTMADSSISAAYEEEDPEEEKPTNVVTDLSNAPYEKPTYSFINAPGRQWIRKYTLALVKEMLGSIRGKYQSVPIPGDETTLDYSRLLDEARDEKETLITQLREDLDATTTISQGERSTGESELQQTQYGLDNPYQIYIH